MSDLREAQLRQEFRSEIMRGYQAALCNSDIPGWTLGDEVGKVADNLIASLAARPEVVVDHRPGETCSVAAEVDPETGFARPLLDREAVEEAIATKVMHYDSGTAVHEVDDGDLAGLVAGTDAVMKLARPMPTQAELAEWLRETFTADSGGTSWDLAAECLLICLNGTES